uniref:Uncharacterized protein n=1 Tax=virus sp. ctah610 TaxID=2826807 RepID=A0A8S5R6Q9_9VIRU|nr:MAG TPA: hypothetical protein [virus sp. ctah610]
MWLTHSPDPSGAYLLIPPPQVDPISKNALWFNLIDI